MTFKFWHSYLTATQAMEYAIAHAIRPDYATSLHLALNDNLSMRTTGLLIVLGITVMLRRGLWKIVVKVFGHWLIVSR